MPSLPHAQSGPGSQIPSAFQSPSWSQAASMHQANHRFQSIPASAASVGFPSTYSGIGSIRQAHPTGQHQHSQAAHWSQQQQSGPSSSMTQRTWQPNQQAPLQATETLPQDFDPLASLLPDAEPGSGSSQQIDWNLLQQAAGSARQQISQHVSGADLPIQLSQGQNLMQHQSQPIPRASLGFHNPAPFNNAAALGSQLSSSLPQGSGIGLARPVAPHTASLMQPSGPISGFLPSQPGLPMTDSPSEPANAPAPGLGPLTRALSAPAGEAFLSRVGDAVKHLPDQLAIMCGTARGTLLTKRARILHEGKHHTPADTRDPLQHLAASDLKSSRVCRIIKPSASNPSMTSSRARSGQVPCLSCCCFLVNEQHLALPRMCRRGNLRASV